MRTILGLLAIAAIVAAIIIGYNWLAGNNNIKIESPSRGETLYTDNTVVRLTASENTKSTLATTGSDYEIVTYLDGNEVHRGKELTYQLNGLSSGSHQLKVAIADNRTEGVNLNGIALQPGAVDFTVTSGSAANSNNTTTLNNAAIPEPTPVVVEAPPAAPAEPQPTAAPAPALPASGEGGGQLANLANSNTLNSSAVNSNPVLFSTMNDAPPPAPETPMQSVFRSLFAFYVAGFVVAFGFVFFSIRRRVRRREQMLGLMNRRREL